MTLYSRATSSRRRQSSLQVLVPAALFAASHIAFAQAKPVPAPAGPDHAGSYYHYGLAHLYEDMAVNAGRSDYATQAIEEYKLALNADPDSKLLQDGLADLYFKLGRIREAVTTAKDLVNKDPNDLEAHTLLGKVYLRSVGDMQTQQSGEMLGLAIAEYEKLTELKPNDVESHLLLGQLYGMNHDSAKAEAQFKAAQKIDSNSEEVVLNMARLYSEQGDMKRAADTLSAVPVDDQTARIEFALGGTYDNLKRPKDAIKAYRAALDLDPENSLDVKRGLAGALILDNQLARPPSSLPRSEPQSRRTRRPRSAWPRSSAAKATTNRLSPRSEKAKRTCRTPSSSTITRPSSTTRWVATMTPPRSSTPCSPATPILMASTPIRRRIFAPPSSIASASSSASRTRPRSRRSLQADESLSVASTYFAATRAR